MNDDTISKAELARRLGKAKSMVTKYVGRGMPVLADGKISLSAAKSWLKANNLAELSGNFVHRRKAQQKAEPVVVEREDLSPRLQYLVSIFEAMRAPGSCEFMAETALALGCTLEQALGIGDQLDALLMGQLEAMLTNAGFPSARVFEMDAPEDRLWIAELAGDKDADLIALRNRAARKIEVWAKRPDGFTGRLKKS